MADSAQIINVNPWHAALSDYMIARPTATLAELSAHFEVSVSWLSVVRNSDGFRDFHARRQDVHFKSVSDTIVAKLAGLTELTLEAITAKIEDHFKGKEMSIENLAKVSEIALKAMGFGAKHSPGIQINDNRKVVFNGDQAALDRARAAIAARREIADAELIEDHADESKALPAAIGVPRAA